MNKKRVLLYSHDTFGLGHIRRNQKIANQLVSDSRSIFIICSSPKAGEFRSQKGIEYLKLPGFTKLMSGNYAATNECMPVEEFTKFRSEVILSATKNFKPDLFIVDKEPRGVRGELLETIDYLKKSTNCQIVCGFRDILDSPENIAKEWEKRKTQDCLLNYYDHIVVYGDQQIYSMEKEYNWPLELQKKLHYVGYIIESGKQLQGKPFHYDFPIEHADKPLVLFTLGGGGDGASFLKVITEAAPYLNQEKLIILPGPFINQECFNLTREKLKGLSHVLVEKFIPQYKSLASQSDLIVSMGGYNTFCENLGLGQKPLILPRTEPRKEQLIRAQIFSQTGHCDYIHPDDLSVEHLIEKVRGHLLENKKAPPLKKEGLSELSLLADNWLKDKLSEIKVF